MQNQSNQLSINKYIQIMDEVRARLRYIGKEIKSHKNSDKACHPMIEVCYLNLRKILELIAFASLCANSKLIEKSFKELAKLWNADDILKYVRKLNPDFFPRPFKINKVEDGLIQFELASPDYPVLTEPEYKILYNQVCGKVLHALNPLQSSLDYFKLQQDVKTWHVKIIGLLEVHEILLVGEKDKICVQMNYYRDRKVERYRLKRVPHPQKQRPL